MYIYPHYGSLWQHKLTPLNSIGNSCFHGGISLHPQKFQKKQAFTIRNSTSFLINPWYFHVLFLQYPLKFPALNLRNAFFAFYFLCIYKTFSPKNNIIFYVANIILLQILHKTLSRPSINQWSTLVNWVKGCVQNIFGNT